MLRRTPCAWRALALCLPFVAVCAHAAQSQFLRLEGARDFLEGELTGLSVDSNGRVRLAPAVKLLQETETPFVWCLATDGKGTVFAGTGNEGKVFRIEGGKASLAFDATELEVHALAVGKDGKLYVATSPDGKVYAVEPGGKSTTFFDPKEKYIWALAFDPSGNLIVATGAEGRVYRVDAKGNSTTLLETAETHVLSLAVDARGTVFAGSAPSGILYRIDPAGKVFVVYDSSYREVKSLDLGREGSVYAALVDGKPNDDSARPSPATPTTPAPTAEVTVTESFGGLAAGPSASSSTAPAAAGGAPKGAVIRLLPGGEVDALWSSSEDMPLALVSTAEGVLVATGSKGKLYNLHDDRTWTLLAVLPAEQLTGLARRSDGGPVVASSSPGKIFGLGEAPGERGTFVSKAKDTETVSAWGRLRSEGEVPAGTDLQIQTRSGNTQTPDTTWSDWSAAYKDPGGQAIASERARFLQMRATLVGKDGKTPILDRVIAAYLQRNLRPEVPQVTIHPPGEVFQKPISVSGDPEILGLDTPTVTAPAQSPPRPRGHVFQPQALPEGLADVLLARRGRERRHPFLRRLLQGGEREPLPSAAQGPLRTGPGLGHLDRPQWPLPHQDRGYRRPLEPRRPGPHRREGEHGLRRGQHPAAGNGHPGRTRAGKGARGSKRRREPPAQGGVLGRRRKMGRGVPPGRHQRRQRRDVRVHPRRPLRGHDSRGSGTGDRSTRQRSQREG